MDKKPQSGQSDLKDSCINLRLLRDLVLKDLTEIATHVILITFWINQFQKAGGKGQKNKAMVLDPTIAGPLGLLAEISVLKVSKL